jgi:hypothetical protein
VAKTKALAKRSPNDWLFSGGDADSGDREASLLDVVDSVLNQGVVLNGDLVLGVANVDLIYAKLSVLLSAMDRFEEGAVVGAAPSAGRKKRRRRRPRSLR